jgi:hypothetical protein
MEAFNIFTRSIKNGNKEWPQNLYYKRSGTDVKSTGDGRKCIQRVQKEGFRTCKKKKRVLKTARQKKKNEPFILERVT